MKNALILIILFFTGSCNNMKEYDKEKIKTEVLKVAEKWNSAWNGEIDLDGMMALHHENLQYYWRGKPMTLDDFKHILEEFVIGIETYNNIIHDPVVTVIDENNAIVGFQLIEQDEGPQIDEGAFTLVITRINSEWKIIHIHEG